LLTSGYKRYKNTTPQSHPPPGWLFVLRILTPGEF
jgi:hypothetical protein